MGVRWAWVTRWPSKLLCPPNNDDLWPLLNPPYPPNSETSHRVHFAQGKSDFVITVLGFTDNVFGNPKPGAKGGSSGRLRGGQAPWLVSRFGMLTTRPMQQHLCAVSFPMSLGSAIVTTAHSCRNAHQLSLLLLAEESASHNMIPSLPGWAPPYTPGCRAVSMAPLSFFYSSLPWIPSSFPLAHFCMLQ